MAQDAVSFVKDLYGAYARGEIQTVLDNLDPDVDWKVVGQRDDHPVFGHWPGRGGAARFFKTVSETVDFSHHQPEAFYGDGDKVFVLGRYDLVDKSTGKPASSEWLHVLTVQDGRVTQFREFTDTATVAASRR